MPVTAPRVNGFGYGMDPASDSIALLSYQLAFRVYA